MDDQTKAIIAGVVRHLLGIAGTWLAAKGVMVSGAQLDVFAGAIMAGVAITWSARHKTTVQVKS
jgi:hypothetical protein